MKDFFQHVLEHTIAICVYSIGVIIMAAIAAILFRYDKQYLWFAPVVIALLLILPFIIIIIIHIIKKKREIIEPKEESKEAQHNQQLEIKDIDLMPLSEAVSKLIDESKQKGTMAYKFAMRNDLNGLYNDLANRIAEYVDIYGKRPSASFKEWIKIPKNVIRSSVFKNMASELWLTSTLYVNYNPGGSAYIDLAIKKADLDKAIRGILSEDTLLFAGS